MRCLDIVLDHPSSDPSKLLSEINNLLSECSEEAKVYVHVLRRCGDRLCDEKIVLTATVKEVLHGRTS